MTISFPEELSAYESQMLNFIGGNNPNMQELINVIIYRQKGSLALQNRTRITLSGLPSQLAFEAPLLPLAFERAQGGHLIDVNGNDYIDCNMSNASLPLGHNPPTVVAAIQNALAVNVGAGQLYKEQVEFAELITLLVPSAERIVYLHTGSEAIAASVRLARANTRKRKVAKFEGCYHGATDIGLHNPPMYLSGKFPTEPLDNITPFPATGGFTSDSSADFLILSFNSSTALKLIRENADELACIVVEPLPPFMSNWPEESKTFISELCAVAQQVQVPVIFDETQSGFRIAKGGAREWAGVIPEMSCYSLGALGLPFAIIAGSARFLDFARTDGQFTDYATGKVWLTSGSEGNYLSLSAALSQFRYIAEHFDVIGNQLDSYFVYLKTRLATFAEKSGIPISLQGHPRINAQLGLGKQEPNEKTYRGLMQSSSMKQFRSLAALSFYLRLEGIYTKLIPTINLSAAHQQFDIENVADAIEKSLLQMEQDGML